LKYKALIFDFGGVIINIDFKLTHQAFKALGIEDLDQKFSQTKQSGFFDQFEKGEISPEAFRKEIKLFLKSEINDAELDMAWNKMLLDIPKKRIEIIESLKVKYPCMLLSNTNQIHYDFYRDDLEKVHGYTKFSELFDKTYFSHEIGMRKPDEDIYHYVLKDLKLEASEVLFIDDTEMNIIAANQMGWNTVLWQNKELSDLVDELM